MNTRAAVLTSSSPRHRHFAAIMAQHFDLRLVLRQDKSAHRRQAGSSPAVLRHFAELDAEERRVFPDAEWPSPPPLDVIDINDALLPSRAMTEGVEVVLLFGTAILKAPWLDAFPNRIVNLHLGLSPFYRGSATLFWPFAQGELECVGTTIHVAAAQVDAGPILARIKPSLRVGDSYYTITNRLIHESIGRMPEIVQGFLRGTIQPVPQVPTSGRVWRRADFDEAALQRALSLMGPGLSESSIRLIQASERCRCSP